jgi:phytoene synthase
MSLMSHGVVLESPNADRLLDLGPAREHARLLLKTYSKSFYLASLLIPQPKRQDVFSLYSFCRYTDNIVDAPRDRSRDLLATELDRWEEELLTAYRTGESQHPVMLTFIDVALRKGIDREIPLELIEGVRMDLLHDRYATMTELSKFCYRVASVVGIMMTHVLGYRHEKAFVHAEQLGMGMQLANILRDVDEDWQLRRKIYIPQEELEAFGVSERDIEERRTTENVRLLMQSLVERADQYFELAGEGIPMLEEDGQFAIHAASRLYRGILLEIKRKGYNVFAGRPVVSTRKKLGTVLRSFVEHRILPGTAAPALAEGHS